MVSGMAPLTYVVVRVGMLGTSLIAAMLAAAAALGATISGDVIAFADYKRGDIVVYDLGTGIAHVAFYGPGRYPAWSPDGRLLAFERHLGVYVGEVSGANLQRLTPWPPDDPGECSWVSSPHWTADGETIIFLCNGTDGRSRAYAATLTRNEPEMVSIDHPEVQAYLSSTAPGPVMAPDGAQRAFIDYSEEGWLLFVGSVTETVDNTPLLKAFVETVADVRWSPDSQRLAVVVGPPTSEPALYLLDVRTGKANLLTTASAWHPAWMPRP